MYQGIVSELPLGTEGLTGSQNPSLMPPGYLVEATNISFCDGTLRKEGGASKYNTTAITGGPTILGGWDHRTNALAQRMVVACDDGKLYKDSGTGAFAVTLKSGLSTSMRPFFVEAGKEAAANNRKLVIFTGTDIVQVLADDGATTANIATPPADWSGTNQPSFGLLHRGRLLAAGNANDPHRLYYSTLTNHEDFTGAGSGTLAIYPGEGEALVGGVEFNGLVVLFKRPGGIYIIDMSNPTASNWTVRKVTDAVGGVSPWAVVPTENDIIYMDATGQVQSLRATETYAQVEGRSISQLSLLEPILREQLSFSQLNQIRGVYYAAKRELHFAFTSSSGTFNDRRLVLDFYRPDKLRYRISPRDTCTALWLRRDTLGTPRIMVGDTDGFVWQLDQNSRSKDGAAYPSKAKTVPTDLGFIDPAYAHREKNAAFLELIYEPTTFNTVNVELEWDGQRTETVGFSLQSSGAVLGTSFILGNAILGGAPYVSTIERITGGGKHLSLAFSNNNLGQDFSVARARLYYTLGN